MTDMINHPGLVSIACFLAMCLSALFGAWLRRPDEDKGSLTLVISATLTLLGLIIGFTFSMASTRYEQRRLYEENEANAIGTEYLRADLLPADQAAAVKHLLHQYLDTRITFYESDYGTQLTLINTKTSTTQIDLWNAVRPQAAAQPTPITALVVSGMNDVLNTQGYTQFAWWNRIPAAAWILMVAIALFANALVGYAKESERRRPLLLLILPAIIAIAFFLIADIDSPRGGIIRIAPVDLISLAQSLPAS